MTRTGQNNAITQHGQTAAAMRVFPYSIDALMVSAKAAKDEHPFTVAVDLDGTIAKPYDKYDAESIEPPRPGVQKALKDIKERGARILIHTCRGDEAMIKKYLKEHDIPFDAINENPDQPDDASDKPLADVYVDDRAVDARQNWEAINEIILNKMKSAGELAAWQETPALVRTRMKTAADIKRRLKKVIKHLPIADDGYGTVYWHPEDKTAWAVLSENDTEQSHNRWYNALRALPSIHNVRIETERIPSDLEDWILIKKAGALEGLHAPYDLAGKPVGGPSPLSNSIVSGLLGAGLGYGGGWLAEKLMPERFVERGRLRRNLAILGGLGGAALPLPQLVANAKMQQAAGGSPDWLKALWRGPAYQGDLDAERRLQEMYSAGTIKSSVWKAAKEIMDSLPDVEAPTCDEFIKTAFMDLSYPSVKPISVDAFNAAIWNDVHTAPKQTQYGQVAGTPPVHAAAATGLVSGVQQMHGGPRVLSPRHFVRGLANAGLDLATARVAGGVLGALGGLKPEAQMKLQDMGLWSGMIRGVTGSVFGLR